MPRLRRLTGKEILDILREFGFEVVSIKGSHHKLRRERNGQKQTLIIPIHGNKALPTGTLRGIYRQALRYIPESALKPRFYTES